MDIFSKQKRSAIMSQIRGENTEFERTVFLSLRAKKVKFAQHPKRFFGSPDLIVKTKKKAVFLDSDYWHGWQYPRWKEKIKKKFWRNKIIEDALARTPVFPNFIVLSDLILLISDISKELKKIDDSKKF